LLLDGTPGSQCLKTKEMLGLLLKKINLPYVLQDERFSSKFSSNDSQAAAFFLSIYLKLNQ